MNRLTITAVALVILCSLPGPSTACVPPEVHIWDWTFFVSPGEAIDILAEDYSGTYIEDWWWTWPQEAGGTCIGQEDYFGLYGTSTLSISFANTGTWEIDAYARNTFPLQDSDYAWVAVITVTVDDDPPDRDTDEYMAYQSATPADIYYTINPDGGFRYKVWLYIKDGLNNAIRTVDLTSLGLGEKHTTWDGKKDDGSWAPPGNYTAIVELGVGNYASIKFSDSHPIPVVWADIDVDSDRDGTISGTPKEDDDEDANAVIVPVNCDDDDDWNDVDCTNNIIDNELDVSDLVPLVVRALPSGWTATLSIESGDPSKLRVFSGNDYWQDGDELWEPGQADPDLSYPILGSRRDDTEHIDYGTVTSYQIPDVTTDLTYYMEALQFRSSPSDGWTLLLSVTNGVGTFEDRVTLRPSPFILLPGSCSSEGIYAPDRSDSDQDDEIAAVGGTIVSMNLGTPYAGDPWLQDAAEIGYTKWPGGQMHVVMDLPRPGRALESWPMNSLLGPDVGVCTVVFPLGDGGDPEDYGGNIEAVGDAHVVIGVGCNNAITSLIAAQGIQSVITAPQTAFLDVGHIDELVSFSGSSAYIVDVDSGIGVIDDFINDNTHASGVITGATADYVEVSTANWTTDQWVGGYVEVMDLWLWQPHMREIVHNDATKIYVYDTLAAKGRRWDPIPDPVSDPTRWSSYALVARSEFRVVFCEDSDDQRPEDFGVVTERVNSNTFRDGSGLHDWSQKDWSGGYAIICHTTQGNVDTTPEKWKIVSNTSDSITLEGLWSGDPYRCRYVLAKKSKRDYAYNHVYKGEPEGDPACMTIRHLWYKHSAAQAPWVSRIDELRTLLLQQTPITSFTNVPGLLYAYQTGDVALLPNMVNLLNSGGNLHVPNPYGPRNANNEDAFKVNSPFNNFVDCWPLHSGYGHAGGEIHCGTNALRTIPSTNWWE